MDLWNSIKGLISGTEIPEAEESEKRTEKIFDEIMAKNIPNFVKEIIYKLKKASRP